MEASSVVSGRCSLTAALTAMVGETRDGLFSELSSEALGSHVIPRSVSLSYEL